MHVSMTMFWWQESTSCQKLVLSLPLICQGFQPKCVCQPGFFGDGNSQSLQEQTLQGGIKVPTERYHVMLTIFSFQALCFLDGPFTAVCGHKEGVLGGTSQKQGTVPELPGCICSLFSLNQALNDFLPFEVSTKVNIPSDWGEWKREAVVSFFCA